MGVTRRQNDNEDSRVSNLGRNLLIGPARSPQPTSIAPDLNAAAGDNGKTSVQVRVKFRNPLEPARVGCVVGMRVADENIIFKTVTESGRRAGDLDTFGTR